ncbi:MAG: phosphoribosylanthranilate isomerase [Endomicrobia bacterium]|nr:phosphoribosylanthranilate isomerase [Endomicrobiia bacterium]
MTKVKICGITNKEDAFWASSLGADFIGLNFVKNSIRKVSLNNAKEIVSSIPQYTSVVCVFVNEDIKNVVKICKKLNVSYVQLHGEETPDYCNQLKLECSFLKIIKVFKIKPEQDLQQQEINDYVLDLYNKIKSYLNYVDYLLFDTYIENEMGGTGKTFSWSVVKQIKGMMNEDGNYINFFIAGGLTPENVDEVVKFLEPWGVDVASGVERLPRRKDFEKMKSFIRKVKSG